MTASLEGRCSIQLSYEPIQGLLKILNVIVGVAGFEPAASTSQTWRDNRATLHPEVIINIAERQGFEPWVPISKYDDLANRSFRPLRHLSIFTSNI